MSQSSGIGMFNRSSNLKENRKRDKLMSQLSDNSNRKNDIVNPADELQWLNFETRMRGVIKGLLEPVVEISQKDREGMLVLEDNFNGHDDRLAKIEEAIFNVSVNGEETLFEKMAKKIKANEIYMKTEIK